MSIFGGIGQAGSRALKTYLTLTGQQREQQEAQRNRALQLALSLAGADEETRPALQSIYEKLGFKIPTGIQFPTRTKAIGDRPAREVLANKPDLLAKLPAELHDQPWSYVLQVRPDFGKTLYGVEPDVKQKAQEILAQHGVMEQRYGRKTPFSPEERQILQQAGFTVPMKPEMKPEVIGTAYVPGQRDPKQGEPLRPEIRELPTGQQVEDLPDQGTDDIIVTIPGLGKKRLGDLPAGVQTEIIRRAFDAADRVEITLSDGSKIQVPRDKAIDYIFKLDQENRLRSWAFILPNGEKVSGLTAGEFVSIYNAGQNREVTLRGQDITARGQDISAQRATGPVRPVQAIQRDIAVTTAQLAGLESQMPTDPAQQAALAYRNPELVAQLVRVKQKLAGLQAELQHAQSQPAGGVPLPPVPPRPGAQQPGPAGEVPAGRYSQVIIAAANEFGVPGDLLHRLLKHESGLNPEARGAAGEVGIAQFMPKTAAAVGIDPSNWHMAIRGAAKHLAQLYKEFGDWSQAVAAYNAGSGAVRSGKIPASTRAYVKAITGADLGSKAQLFSAGSVRAQQRQRGETPKKQAGGPAAPKPVPTSQPTPPGLPPANSVAPGTQAHGSDGSVWESDGTRWRKLK